MSIVTEKVKLRKEMSQKRDSIKEADRKRQEGKVIDFFKNTDFFDGYNTIYLYASFRSEFPTWNIMELLWEKKKRVLLPKVEGSPQKIMDFFSVNNVYDLKCGYMGILEPKSEKPVFLPGIMLLPGLAFDKEGGRLGYGGGYYDAFLLHAQLKNLSIKTLGLCFNEQIIPKVPAGAQDVKVQGIICPDMIMIEKET